MSARILERAAACVWQASRRLLTGYRLTGVIEPLAYRTVAGATACGTPALERMAKGTLRLVREAELERALARRINRLARLTRMDEPQALLGVRRRRTLSEILPARLSPAALSLPNDPSPDLPSPAEAGFAKAGGLWPAGRSFGSAQAGRRPGPKSYGGQDFGGLPSDTEPDGAA